MEIPRRGFILLPLEVIAASSILDAQSSANRRISLEFFDEVYGIKPISSDAPKEELADFTETTRPSGEMEKLADASDVFGLTPAPRILTGDLNSLKVQYGQLKQQGRASNLSHLDLVLLQTAEGMIQNPNYLASNGWRLGLSRIAMGPLSTFSAEKEIEIEQGRYRIFANAFGKEENGKFLAERLVGYFADNERYAPSKHLVELRQFSPMLERWWAPIPGQNSQRRTRISYPSSLELPLLFEVPDFTGIREKIYLGIKNQDISIASK